MSTKRETSTGAAADAVERAAETVQLALPLRAGLHHALRLRAAKEGTTMRAIVLSALRDAGLPVEDIDLADRRADRGNRGSRRTSQKSQAERGKVKG
jgi:hypothetical protein